MKWILPMRKAIDDEIAQTHSCVVSAVGKCTSDIHTFCLQPKRVSRATRNYSNGDLVGHSAAIAHPGVYQRVAGNSFISHFAARHHVSDSNR